MNTSPRPDTPTRCRATASPRAAAGFTLVDLVVVISIAVILTTIAAPSFTAFIASQRARNAATDLYVALIAARSEATMRNTNVTLAPVSGGWKNGWTIADPAVSGRNVLDHGALAGAMVTGPDNVVFQRSGRVRGAAPSFTVTAAAGAATATRCVLTDLSGRPYIQPC